MVQHVLTLHHTGECISICFAKRTAERVPIAVLAVFALRVLVALVRVADVEVRVRVVQRLALSRRIAKEHLPGRFRR